MACTLSGGQLWKRNTRYISSRWATPDNYMQYLLDNECEILLCPTNAVLGSAMTRSLGFLVGRREEGAEKLDEGTLVWAEMEVEGVNNFLSRKAQIRWTVPTAAWFILLTKSRGLTVHERQGSFHHRGKGRSRVLHHPAVPRDRRNRCRRLPKHFPARLSRTQFHCAGRRFHQSACSERRSSVRNHAVR